MRFSHKNLRKCRLLGAFLFIPTIALFAACGGGDSGPAPATVAPTEEAVQPAAGVKLIEVFTAYVQPHYQPNPIVLKVGEPIQFKVISSDTQHTFTIDGLNVDLEIPQKLKGGAVLTQVVIPTQAGTLRLWCRIHTNVPTMEGEVRIVD